MKKKSVQGDLVQGGNMGLNAVNSSLVSPLSDSIHQNRPQNYGRPQLPGNGSQVEARLASEYYSSKSLFFEYTSKDGDTVHFSMESVEYSRSMMEVSAQGDQEDMEKLVNFIKESYDQLKKEILNGFLKSVGYKVEEEEEVDAAEKLEVPEYWNAENTSQRIVDFAVSFYSLFDGSGSDYIEMIKGAIEDGFAQAREMLGEVPDEISALVDDTYQLVMEKMDAWAVEQGIEAASGEEVLV